MGIVARRSRSFHPVFHLRQIFRLGSATAISIPTVRACVRTLRNKVRSTLLFRSKERQCRSLALCF
jgi:hypothetical protein